MAQQGQMFKLKTRGADGKPTWAYRYRVDGRRSARPQVGGFASQGEAVQALKVALERLHRRNGRVARITLSELVEEYLAQHEAAPCTIAKLRWLLAKATCAFGDRRVVELRSDEIGAWRTSLPEGHRFEATQALRQVLNRAVAWRILDSNPARAGVDNPRRQHPEKRPFESWAEVDALAEQLGPVYGPMIVFAAATGLRPSEWAALEHRDLDREARVVYVRRAFAHGRLQGTKTRRSTRAVPLQAIALDALDRLPVRLDTSLLFPAPRGGYLDLRHLPLHGCKPDDDRPPLRAPRPRRARVCGGAPRLACRRGDRDRVDVGWTPRSGAGRQVGTGFRARSPGVEPLGGRLVDVERPIRRPASKRNRPVCSVFCRAL